MDYYGARLVRLSITNETYRRTQISLWGGEEALKPRSICSLFVQGLTDKIHYMKQRQRARILEACGKAVYLRGRFFRRETARGKLWRSGQGSDLLGYKSKLAEQGHTHLLGILNRPLHPVPQKEPYSGEVWLNIRLCKAKLGKVWHGSDFALITVIFRDFHKALIVLTLVPQKLHKFWSQIRLAGFS